ncbi:MAG: hypothetical protein H3C47_12580 [Candidatus Cloacimonetes bacterium]|nr:hypothetical protein [Candidatus Cloacimonadota bacterium]
MKQNRDLAKKIQSMICELQKMLDSASPEQIKIWETQLRKFGEHNEESSGPVH